MNCCLKPSRGAVATTSSNVSRSNSAAASRRRRPTCRRRAAATPPRPRPRGRSSGRGSRAQRGRPAPASQPTARSSSCAAAAPSASKSLPRSCDSISPMSCKQRSDVQDLALERARLGEPEQRAPGVRAHAVVREGAAAARTSASSSAARAAALSGIVRRSRSWRSRRAPSIAHPARGEARDELAQPFVRHRLFLPIAGHRRSRSRTRFPGGRSRSARREPWRAASTQR